MLVYITRRIIAGAFVMVGASFIVYMLMTQAGDPLAFTLEITNPTQRASVIDEVTRTLSLDVPPVQRYLEWLQRLVFEQDFGLVSVTQQPVSEELARRIPMTLKLVTAATVLSVVIGVITGIVTALRQYSGFDYLVTFTTFLFFSLPVFWVAVILKAWGGINFNDWLRDGARFSPTFIVVIALLMGVVGTSFAGGSTPRRLAVGAITGGIAAALMVWASATQWLLDPGFGPIVFALISGGITVGVIMVFSGWNNVRARNSALVTCGVLIVAYFPLQLWFDTDGFNIWMAFGLLAMSLVVGTAVGYLVGGYDRGQSARWPRSSGS
jgi:peptide/nickel transport system permease protein